MAEELVSIEIKDSPLFVQLQGKYRQSIMDDTTLSKAATIRAKQELLFMSDKPDAWKVPRARLNSRMLNEWTKKARSMNPAGLSIGALVPDVDETPVKRMVDEL